MRANNSVYLENLELCLETLKEIEVRAVIGTVCTAHDHTVHLSSRGKVSPAPSRR